MDLSGRQDTTQLLCSGSQAQRLIQIQDTDRSAALAPQHCPSGLGSMFCVKQRWVSFPPFDLSLALSHRVLEAAQAQSLPLSLMYLTLGCDALQLPPSCYLLCPAGRSTWHLTCPHNVPVLLGALRDRIFPSLGELLLFL